MGDRGIGRSCRTPASRSGSRASSSTPRAPTTSAGWSATCWTPGRGSSAAAAGRRPSTSPRCARRSTPGSAGERRRAEPPRPARGADRRPPGPRLTTGGDRRRPARCRAAADRARPGAGGRPVRDLGRDRPAALGPHRPDDRGRPPPQGRRRRHRQRQRLGDGPRPDGRAGRRVRDPARPRPRVRRPLHDPRPEPHGPRVRAARRARARASANILALTGDPPRIGDYPTGDRASGTSIRSGSSRSSPGSTAARTRPAARSAQPAGFTIACALDPTAADAATEWDRLERKLAAGAHLIMTQPLYDLAQVEAMDAEARRRFGPRGFPLPVLLGPAAAAEHPPHRVPPQRGARHHDPGADARRDARCGRARRGGRPGPQPRAARAGPRPRRRDLRHAQLRAVRAGGGAGPPDPRRHAARR